MFAEKLDSLMNLLDITNTELANKAYLDPSYISKLRKGSRKLPKDPAFLEDISVFMIDQAKSKGRMDLLGQMIEAPIFLEEETNQSIFLANWLSSKVELTDIISSLLKEISEEDLRLVVDPFIKKRSQEEVYYYGTKGRQEAMLRLFQALHSSEKKTKVRWYSDEPLEWTFQDNDFLEEYANHIGKLLSQGHEVEIFYNNKDYMDILSTFSFWAPFLMTGNVEPYIYDAVTDENLLRVHCAVEGICGLISMPSVTNGEDRLTVYITDPRAVESMSKDFDYMLDVSRPLAEVSRENITESYETMFTNLFKEEGNYYYKDIKPSFHTLPEKVAKNLDESYPGMGIMKTYRFAREMFNQVVEEGENIEDILLLDTDGDEFHILFGGLTLEYSREDYIDHLEEIIRLLNTKPNYDIHFSEVSTSAFSLMINSGGGVLIERYYDPKTLVYIKDKDLGKAFADCFKDRLAGAEVKGGDDSIRYIREVIDQIKDQDLNKSY